MIGADWYLKKGSGTIYGPVDLESLQAWARDGRIAPEDQVSTDRETWEPAPDLPPLEMRWFIELPGGGTYGPAHMAAFIDMLNEGALDPETPIRFKADGAPRPLRELVEPPPAPEPVAPPPPEPEPEAVAIPEPTPAPTPEPEPAATPEPAPEPKVAPVVVDAAPPAPPPAPEPMPQPAPVAPAPVVEPAPEPTPAPAPAPEPVRTPEPAPVVAPVAPPPPPVVSPEPPPAPPAPPPAAEVIPEPVAPPTPPAPQPVVPPAPAPAPAAPAKPVPQAPERSISWQAIARERDHAEREAAKWKAMCESESEAVRRLEAQIHAMQRDFEKERIAGSTAQQLLEKEIQGLKKQQDNLGQLSPGGDAGLIQAYRELSRTCDLLAGQIDAKASELKEAQDALHQLRASDEERLKVTEAQLHREREEADRTRARLQELEASHREIVQSYREMNDRYIRMREQMASLPPPPKTAAPVAQEPDRSRGRSRR